MSENVESFLKALKKIQKLDFNKFKKNADLMTGDFNRDEIAKKMLKFIIN